MNDEFKKHFRWLTDLLKRPLTDYFKKDSAEYEIMNAFKDGWESRASAGLLKELTAKYGEKAGQTVEKFLELNLVGDWAGIGKKRAHPGTEVEDFIRVLWDPLKDLGFEFTKTTANGRVRFPRDKMPVTRSG